jgi:hypothetical protein
MKQKDKSKLRPNLETTVARLDQLLSQVNPNHTDFAHFQMAVNTAIKCIRVTHSQRNKRNEATQFKKD